MSNWVAQEWAAFKTWLTKEHASLKSEVADLRKEVEALKAKLP